METRPAEVRIKDYSLHMRNVRMRLPFRYGKAVLVAAPLLHLRLVLETESGDSVTAVAADMLPPKWFDKDPEKTFQNNIEDLVTAAKLAGKRYSDAAVSPITPFDLWRTAHPTTLDDGKAAGLNGLTAQFGSSLFERAVVDGAGRLYQKDFHTMLAENRLGLRPEEVFNELKGVSVQSAIPPAPPGTVAVRHTIGIGDPLRAGDGGAADRVNGLPATVEAWIRDCGVRFFKIKVTGDAESDIGRLESIAGLLNESADAHYRVTLDGNEQFSSPDDLREWWTQVESRATLNSFLPRVLFFEQPVERAKALSVRLAGIDSAEAAMPPLIIDESDESVESFRTAAELGYRGVSAKNCKGVFKSVLNAMLVARMNEKNGANYFLTAEDLCNQPIAPLQQDLCVVASLGVTHAERNGHHYCGALDHVSESELRGVLSVHASLYEPFGDTARVRIRDGVMDVSSLRTPGLGVAVETDFENMTPVDEWNFDSLGINEN